ncbi:GNAT family N-acetyltransferase [Pseudoalteromonas tunicata]|uniref:tRNA(Met) cytidine acetyltransferase TmcA n=1 Tax=Pseudoalteromonas tunicata TaxID=314281 RepID=UPI00273F7F0E|nr:GNAT family N-acetyltransferase [Pseudoalteromonas tunicata]MDP5214756.1 GNAT family N-acetyltransferase [Pseudoalteromonas tunicata]
MAGNSLRSPTEPLKMTELNQLSPYLAQLKQNRHRQLLVVSGEHLWCYQQANDLLPVLLGKQIILSTHNELTNAQWPEHTHQLLGQEFDFAVYDGFSGISPDKLAALSGTITAGGLLILLLPEYKQLCDFKDPSFYIFQSAEQLNQHSHFNQRFASQLSKLAHISFDQALGLNIPKIEVQAREIQTEQQQAAVEMIIKHSLGRANRPLLLTADRGRGKSSALGLAAAQLVNQGKNVVITTSQRRAVESAFNHFAMQTQFSAQAESPLFRYIPPDQLISQAITADILFVDEAASLPVPILIELLKRFNRIIFATTIHGYEGTGRGFTLRFCPYLKQHFPDSRFVHLDEPIRFASNDPLEININQLLGLNADCTELKQLTAPLQFSEVSQATLCENEPLLQQTFALLVLAHYQTSANDFRHLLDAANLRIFVVSHQEEVIATALVAIEGELSNELSSAIVAGKRRPQGHLLAQSVAQIKQQQCFLTEPLARIVRIAVHPYFQSQNIGHQLLSFIETHLATNVAAIGASFGAYPVLVHFWMKQDYQVIKLGFKKDSISAEHACLVIKPITGLQLEINQLKQRFNRDFPLNCLHYLQHIEPKLLIELIEQLPHNQSEPDDLVAISQLCIIPSQLADHFACCWRVMWQQPAALKNCTEATQLLLTRLILQNKSPQQIEKISNFGGLKKLQAAIKHALLEWFTNLER